MFEMKDLPLDLVEIKLADGKSGSGEFEGYASTFGNKDSYGDVIEKGAFADTLKSGRRVLMLDSHNAAAVIGKWKEMKEDDRGLFVRGEFTPNHTRAADVYASMKHGAVNGMSIGFRIPKGGAEFDEDTEVRTISRIDLIEVSVVAMPANEMAMVSGVKSDLIGMINEMESKRDAEVILREAGISKSAALAFVSRAFRVARSESGSDELGEIKRILKETVTKSDLEDLLSRL